MPHALACLTLIAILVTASLSAAAAERCAEIVGRVVAAEPSVEVVLGPDRRALAPGEPLCAGDILTSGDAERAVVVLEGGGTIQLAPGSTVTISGQAKEGRTVVRLLRGIIRLFGRRQPLEVDTPFADAAVEGTEFAVRLEADRTRVAVLEGRVRVSNPQGALRVDAGQAAVAVAGRAPELELRIHPRDAVRWALYYPPLGEARLPPGTPAAVREAARLEAEGQRAEALARLDSVPPNARDATYQTLRAELLLGTGRPEEAEAALAEALRQQPDDADALALRSVMAVAANDNDRALADARRAVELAPKSVRARLALSYAAQASFDIPLARKSLEAAVKAAPDDALAWARLAETQLMQGDVRAATRSAAKAVALDPKSARAQTVHGFAALARIDTRQAKADFARALELQSFNPLARLGLGLATIRGGDLAAGRQQIELAVALDPDDALLRSYLGKAYLDQRRDALAGDELSTAKAIDPNDPTPWFYDAIRKQLDNRPVEALQDLEHSAALNDNRAPFRSRLLLDQDVATRAAALGRIFDDLGFRQLGINEAARSLARDPTSSDAHRFLADVYNGQPRVEIARVSELLQSQLLQPVGRNPIQPSLSFTDLGTVARSGPAQVGFNEFGPLFARNGIQLDATGVVGTDATVGDEIAATTLAGQTSFSVGQLHYKTDGFRENNNLDNNIYDLFGQTDLSQYISLQTEYRRRDTTRGDRTLNFDLNDFDRTLRDSIEDDIFRVGARLTPAPGHVGLLSAIYSDRKDSFSSGDETTGQVAKDHHTKVGQIEAQYLGTFGPFHVIAGASRADSNDQQRQEFDGSPGGTSEIEARASNLYLLSDVALGQTLDLTARIGYADVDLDKTGMAAFTPGLGIIWQPLNALRLRGAIGRTVKRPYVANQTLEPTQLAGFNELLDDLDGTRADELGVGVDLRAGGAVWLGAEAFIRRLARELSGTNAANRLVFTLDDQRDDRAAAYLYWTPTDRLALSMQLVAERWSAKQRDNPELLRVRTWTTPLQLTYSHPAGWFTIGRISYIAQDVDGIADNGVDQTRGHSDGVLVDLAAGYRLPGHRGIAALEADNLFDRRLSFQDEAFRSSRNEVNPRFIPSRTLLARFTLSF